MIVLNNTHFGFYMGDDSQITAYAYSDGVSRSLPSPRSFSVLYRDGLAFPSLSAVFENGILILGFENGLRAKFRVESRSAAVIFTLTECPDCDKIEFARVKADGMNSVGMSLNPFTNGPGIIYADGNIFALAYRRTGLIGASVAVAATSDRSALRELMKTVTSEYTDGIPWSAKGGAFALDVGNEDIDGSYLMNVEGIKEEDTDRWIEICNSFGFTQIDFHGGEETCRFGDCRFNPLIYPEGRDSVRRVIAKLHSAGIKAGLHTYSQFISPASEFITPVPSRELAGSLFTLAKDTDSSDLFITVNESTDGVSAVTGFFIANSIYLQIDDELMCFEKAENGVFTLKERGALGTSPAFHRAGSSVKHLMQEFGLFVPDGDSELYLEVARRTAENFNYCGFDMMYLDAIDGTSAAVCGCNEDEKEEYSWFYANRFVSELMRKLNKPHIIEMSSMWQHFWYYRSRMGAWDHSNRAHKCLLSAHDAANMRNRDMMFMKQNFGWWCAGTVNEADPCQHMRMYGDDYEFFAYRALEHGWSLSFILEKKDYKESAELQRAAALIGKYERRRKAGKGGIKVNECLMNDDGELLPVQYYSAQNPTESLPLRFQGEGKLLLFRLENTPAVSADDGIEVLSPADESSLSIYPSLNATASVTGGTDAERDFLEFSFSSDSYPSCVRFEKRLDSVNAEAHSGLGVWLCGDGSGATVDIQLISPKAMNSGTCDRLIKADFIGWKYITLYRSGAEQLYEYQWPFINSALPQYKIAGDIPYSQYEWHPSRRDVYMYQLLREPLYWECPESVSVLIGGLEGKSECHIKIGTVTLFPLKKRPLTDPCVIFNGKAVKVKGTLAPYSYIEYRAGKVCAFDKDGKALSDVSFNTSGLPDLKLNNVVYSADGSAMTVTVGREAERQINNYD